MKKLFTWLMVAVFLMGMSVGAVAENGDDGVFTSSDSETGTGYWEEYGFNMNYDRTGDDGVAWFNEVDSNDPGAYTNLKELDRKGQQLDRNTGGTDDDQEVAVKLNAEAYIPCYIELQLTGNQGTTKGQSFGPDTNPNSGNAAGYLMVFDNEIGGFVDENWMSKGAGKNAEVEPGENVFIQACDIFKVDIYGNEDYRYEVKSEALTAVDNSGAALSMDMGTSLDGGNNWSADITFDALATEVIDEGEATESISALHRFRVPYTKDTVHGKYNGQVIFRAVSI